MTTARFRLAFLPIFVAVSMTVPWVTPRAVAAGATSVTGGASIQIIAAASTANVVVVGPPTSGSVVVSDTAGVTPAGTCSTVSATSASCPVAPLDITLSDLGDTLTIDAAFVSSSAIDGGPGDDQLTGGGGSDTFDEGSTPNGADDLSGGSSADAVDYSARSEPTGVSFDQGNDDDGELCPGLGCEADTVTGIEEVRGGSQDDELVGQTASALVANAFQGNAGNDKITGGPGPDSISGGSGNDEIVGSDGGDVIVAGPDADQIVGGTGHDVASYEDHSSDVTVMLNAGADDGSIGEGDKVDADTIDEIRGGTGDDLFIGTTFKAERFRGDAGSDTVSYASETVAVAVDLDGNDDDGGLCAPVGSSCEGDDVETDVENVIGGPGNDHLVGNDATDGTLDGGTGDDALDGGFGADLMLGGTGSETNGDTVTYASRTSGVTVTIGDGLANDGNADDSNADEVGGDVENLIGGSGADGVTGDGSNEEIRTGAGTDTINGGDGDDRIVGGADADDENGDSGNDSFDQESGPNGGDTIDGGNDVDVVTYENRPALSLNVSLNNTADDGRLTEGDDVQDSVENVIGGPGADAITGSDFDNVLTGGPGDDDLSGLGGLDDIQARDGGHDDVFCGAATDTATVDDFGTDTIEPACETAAFSGTTTKTSIDTAPKNRTKKRRFTFTFSSSIAESGFRCQLDTAAVTACDGGTFTTPRLSFKRHTFQVWALDSGGFIDPFPAVATWKVIRR